MPVGERKVLSQAQVSPRPPLPHPPPQPNPAQPLQPGLPCIAAEHIRLSPAARLSPGLPPFGGDSQTVRPAQSARPTLCIAAEDIRLSPAARLSPGLPRAAALGARGRYSPGLPRAAALGARRPYAPGPPRQYAQLQRAPERVLPPSMTWVRPRDGGAPARFHEGLLPAGRRAPPLASARLPYIAAGNIRGLFPPGRRRAGRSSRTRHGLGPVALPTRPAPGREELAAWTS